MLAELFAPILRWPLHSPARFAAVLAALIAVFTATAAVTGGDRPATTHQAADPVPTAEATAGQTAPPPMATTGTARSPAAATGTDAELDFNGGDADARTAAVLFTTRWARPHLSTDQWLAELAGITDPAYLQLLSETDPARVPAAAVTGPAQPVLTGDYYAEYLVPTDTGQVTVRVTYNGTRWVAVSIRPLDRAG